MYKNYIKHLFDFITALVGLIVLSPLFIIVTVALFISNQGEPFFFQTRPGKNEKLFRIVKFKTMNNKKDSNGKLLPDEQRLTKIGNFIRKTSLDEIPQLINVLNGDMSLIGPRPLLSEYLPLFNVEQKKRHLIRPGITGWAQVNGRNSINWQQKFAYDVWYVDKMSFLFDIKILFLTVKKVFVSEGISQDGIATVDYFKGNE
jgi:undecaprenyl phosphate N,N'-diacetylbacillosamine 1-phosphate transferase